MPMVATEPLPPFSSRAAAFKVYLPGRRLIRKDAAKPPSGATSATVFLSTSADSFPASSIAEPATVSLRVFFPRRFFHWHPCRVTPHDPQHRGAPVLDL